MRKHMRKQTGFTLVEIIVVVAIVGILAAVAIPSYQNSVTKGRRVDAMSALQGLAQAMERHYMTTGAYTGAADADDAPTIFSATSPLDSSNVYYNLTISAAATNTYTLQATPVNAQAGDGNITLTQTGARTWGSNACWETSC